MLKKSIDELERIDIDEFRAADRFPLVIVSDNVRSLHNIGSFFRTADSFFCEKIYLCGISATPPNRDIHKTALGAEDSVPWQYFKETIDALESLKAEGYTIIAIEQVHNSLSLPDFRPVNGRKYALIFGNEVRGVQQDVVSLCNCSIEIPQSGTKHSLNVSVAAGVVIWHFYNAYIA